MENPVNSVEPEIVEWLSITDFIERNYDGDGCSANSIAEGLQSKLIHKFMLIFAKSSLVEIRRVHEVCNWLVENRFIIRTFTFDHYFPVEISISSYTS